MKLKKYFLKLIDFYQKYISFYIKPSCVFHPSCSEYTKQAIEKYGILKGSRIGFFRILRCYPWQKKHIDPVK